MTQPHCRTCDRGLIWTERRSRTWTPAAKARWRRDTRRLAYRCADCQHVFCLSCAKKHFAPVLRTLRVVERTLERKAVAAVRGITCKHPRG